MNERIQQLAEQALNEYNATYHNEAKIPEAYLEKFAELMVQECADVIEQNLFQGIGWNTSRAVKRHFGIEVEE